MRENPFYVDTVRRLADINSYYSWYLATVCYCHLFYLHIWIWLSLLSFIVRGFGFLVLYFLISSCSGPPGYVNSNWYPPWSNFSFRDRRYEYKGLNKIWKGKLAEAKASGNSMMIQEAQVGCISWVLAMISFRMLVFTGSSFEFAGYGCALWFTTTCS